MGKPTKSEPRVDAVLLIKQFVVLFGGIAVWTVIAVWLIQSVQKLLGF